MERYNHKKVEKKWQKDWQKSGLYKTKETDRKEKRYILDMFPYPSGEGVHVGHLRGYIPTDAYSRFLRMKGYNVLHPMGWDAFGLPAEGYAIKNKVHPKKAVKNNVARYRKQLSRVGLSYDWDREIDTTDPEYYRWTQWIFLQMFKKGLAYESYEPINWCPSCKTGLANEDLENGLCERCDSEVEQKPMRQWVLKITDYAESLLKDLDLLPNWPESVKESQRNWIGKSQGAEIDFPLVLKGERESEPSLTVFTTRPDTLFGATYMVVAPEHKVIDEVWNSVENKRQVRGYIERAKRKTELQRTSEAKKKTGVELKGVSVLNPVNGEMIPVWVADYVMAHYGTGAIMAVPAHDERDFEFATKMDLPIRHVIFPKRVDEHNPPIKGKRTVARKMVHVVVTDPKTGKTLFLKWKKHDWTTFVVGGVEDGEDVVEAARREVEEETGYSDLKFVKKTPFYVEAHYYAAHKKENRKAYTSAVHFELISNKQRKVAKEEMEKHEIDWLSLDKIAHTLTCAELDVWLGWLKSEGDYAYTGDGILENSGEFTQMESQKAKEAIRKKAKGRKRTTYKLKDWVFSRQRYWGEPIPLVHCESCGTVAVPEKDLPVKLPNVKSYEPTGTGESPLANISSWVNTKCPKCKGTAKRETNTMPQWAGSCWYYLRFTDTENRKEFVSSKRERYWMPVDMYVGGIEHATRHLIYSRFWHKFLYNEGLISTKEPFSSLLNQGLVLGPDGRKMSKRWGNVVSPDDVIDSVGADSIRIYAMFMGPFSGEVSWNLNGPVGAHRFLEKVWKMSDRVSGSFKSSKRTKVVLNQTVKKVGEDIASFSTNTAISSIMILVKKMDLEEGVSKEDFKILLLLLAPFAPHITEELWQRHGWKGSIHKAKWPEFKEDFLFEDSVTVVFQVNGKTRGKVEVSRGSSKEEVFEALKGTRAYSFWCEGKEIRRVVYIPDRLLNVVF